MKMFSPISIYEEGHRVMVENQPRYYARFRELLNQGMVLVLGSGDDAKWIILAPSSRLEQNVFHAQDLRVPGAAGQHEVPFAHVDFMHDTDETSGWLWNEAGNPVADFRRVGDCDDPTWVEFWNTHSGGLPAQYYGLLD